MNIEKNQHYVNKNGKQLNDFLKQKFSYVQMKAWYTMQIMKYLTRAGAKVGESEAKDRSKAFDYAGELANLINENEAEQFTAGDMIAICQEWVNEFKEW